MGFFSTILVRRASSSLKAAIAKSGGGFGVTKRSHLSAIAAIVNNNTRIQGAAFTSSSHYHFSTSSIATKKPTTDHTLVRVIESEIKCAQETDDLDRVEATPDAFPFEIQDNPGEQTILLKREYEGEVIKVEVHMPDLVTGEDDEDVDEDNNGSQSSIPLVINITKGDELELEFGVTAYPDEVAIESFSVKKSDTSEDQIPYEGPDFSSLDENLQKAFHKYLEIRGIKPSTTNFLHEYMINKDSREYLLWLKNLKKFVEK